MMPAVALNSHALFVLILTGVALWLFRSSRIPLESSSLTIIILLAVSFELFPYISKDSQLSAVDFFQGFGHQALIAVCALMVAGQGLVRTGALEPVGRLLSKLWRISPSISTLATMIIAGVLSAFINNTPIVVLLLPILISVAIRTNAPASKMLLPMGLATLVGGMATTIGTSTNLLVVSVAEKQGLERFSMFDFFIPAMICASIALVYLWLVAPKILPIRQSVLDDASPRLFSAALSIKEDSTAADLTLSELIKKTEGKMKVSRIKRSHDTTLMPIPDTIIKAGDRLHVKDTPDNLREFESVLGATLYSGDSLVDASHPLIAKDQQMAEIVVVRGSSLVGRTLESAHFIDQYNLAAVAVHRAGKEVGYEQRGINATVLREGDVLLIQGSSKQISSLKKQSEFLVLDATEDLPRTNKSSTALIIMAGIVLTSAFGILPIEISALCGVMLMIQTQCLNWQEASRALSASVILIVAASLALGKALIDTGGVDYLAYLFLVVTDGASAPFVLSGLILLLAILTNIVSNNAAAVIGTPIAISVAQQIGAPPEPFVIGVLFGANMSYATPMAYKTNLLVMNAGGYQFSDFLRVGIPLTVLMWLSASVVLSYWYNLSSF